MPGYQPSGGTLGDHILLDDDDQGFMFAKQGDTMPRLMWTPGGGLLVGNGTDNLETLTSESALGNLESIEAGAAETITFANDPTIVVELSADLTLTFAGLAPYRNYKIIFLQDATGGWTVTWPTVSWLGGIAPFINTAPSSWTPVELTSDDGGVTWMGVSAPLEGNSPLAYGILEAFPYEGALIGAALTSGVVRYTYFTAPTSGTFDTIITVTGTTAAATVTGNVMAGLYEVTNASTGALGDRIATTGHVATLWNTVSIPYETALTAAVDIVAGQRYATAVLCVATTQPILMSRGVNSNLQAGWGALHATMSPKRMAICSAQTDLVADGSGLTLGFSQSTSTWVALKAS
jgi:hypothetical protein